MRPTRLRLLLGVAVVVGVLVWGALRAWQERYGSLPDVAWTTPAALGLAAGGVLVTALVARPRLRRAPGTRPVPPLVAARLAALALASSRAGAAAAGAYAGFGVVLLGELDTEYGRDRAVVVAAAIVASMVLVGAALLLEHACRIREPDDESGRPGGSSRDDGPPEGGLGSPA